MHIPAAFWLLPACLVRFVCPSVGACRLSSTYGSARGRLGLAVCCASHASSACLVAVAALGKLCV